MRVVGRLFGLVWLLERGLIGVPQRFEDRTRGGIDVLFDRLVIAFQLESSLAGGKTAGAQSSKFGLNLVLLKGNVVGLVLLGPEIGDGEALLEVCAEIVHPTDREHDVHAKLGGALVQGVVDGSRGGHLEDFEIGSSHDCGVAMDDCLWLEEVGIKMDDGSERAADPETPSQDATMIQWTMQTLSHAK